MIDSPFFERGDEMSISDTVKKVMPYLKTASGYVLHRLSSQAVEMDDGTTLEQKVTSLNSLISNKVDMSDVVNNCLTTEEGFVLDARQGKAIDDKITELNGKLEDTHTFSMSDEIDTGETWVDGKRIYRRTYITTETVSPSSTVTIPMSLVGIADTLWIDTQNSYIRSANGDRSYPLPLPRYSGTENYVGVWCNGAGIRIFSDSGWNQQWEKCVTVRYTKV